jgi:hypothetical protein
MFGSLTFVNRLIKQGDTSIDEKTLCFVRKMLASINSGIVSEPRAVATGSRGTFRNPAGLLIRSLTLAVLTQIRRPPLNECRALPG